MGERLQTDQDVVVVMDRIVEPLPRRVALTAFAQQPSLEVELGPAFGRVLPLAGPAPTTERRVRGQSLPTVERRSTGSHPAVLFETEGDQHPGGVSDETEMG